MRRLLAIMAVVFMAFMVTSSSAHAEAPPKSISKNVNDTTGTLDIERLNLLVEQVQAETDYELFVYVTDGFNGMSGAQWAVEAARGSNLNAANNVLFTIATKDRKFGSAFPKGTSVASKISKLEDAAMPDLKKGDWNAAIEAYGNELVRVAHNQDEAVVIQPRSEKVDNATAGFLGVIGWILASAAGLAVLVFGWIFGSKGLRSVLKRKNDIKTLKADFAKTYALLPSLATTLDEKIQDVREKVSFAEGLYGKKALTAANENIAAAAKNSTAGLGMMVELEEIDSTTKKPSFSDLRSNAALLNDAHTAFTNGISSAETADKQVAKVEEEAQALSGIIDDLEAKEKSTTTELLELSVQVAPLTARFDQGFTEPMRSALDKAQLNSQYSAQAVEEARKGLTENDLSDSQDDIAKAKESLGKTEKSMKVLKESIENVGNYSAVRTEMIGFLKKEVATNQGENTVTAVAKMLPLIDEAISKLRSLDCDSGNPDILLTEAVNATQPYTDAVNTAKATKLRVSAAAKNLEADLSNAINAVNNVANEVNRYNVKLGGLRGSLDTALSLANKDAYEISQSIFRVNPYDEESMVKLANKASHTLASMKSTHVLVLAEVDREKHRLQAIKDEEERQRRAEEARREEERRAERRREQERASAAAAAASYSSSSSSDFGSSGGSFGGDSGSGGSF